MLLKNKGLISELTLEISAVSCQLDSSGSVHTHSDGTTVPAERCCQSVILKQLHIQFFHNLNNAAAHYYTQDYTGLSETLCCCCVAKWRTSDRDRPAAWCYHFGEDIDRRSSAEYPQLELQAHCVCAACSVTPCSTVQLVISLLQKILSRTEQAGSVSRSQL